MKALPWHLPLLGVVVMVAVVHSGVPKKDKKADGKETKEAKDKDKKPAVKTTFLDPKEAGLDYAIQGEYVGAFKDGSKLGCQVIALGNEHFQAVFFPGGLPGAGWDSVHKILAD